MAEIIKKALPYISENKSLVQEQTTIFIGEDGKTKETTSTVVLIDNIWDDLKSEEGTWKSNKKKTYFYWEVEVSEVGGDSLVKQQFEAPQPTVKEFTPEGATEPDLELTGSAWAIYWKKKIQTALDNSEKSCYIQPAEKEISGITGFVDKEGIKNEQTTTTKNTMVGNPGDELISNILSIF